MNNRPRFPVELVTNFNTCRIYPSFNSYDDWNKMLDQVNRNRLTSYLSHYQTCPKCQKKINSRMQLELNILLFQLKSRWLNYLKIKKLLKHFICKNKLRIFILKDYEEDRLKGYPSFYIPLKYDLDIMGDKNDLDIIRPFIIKLGFQDQRKKNGYPDNSISQYKFNPKKEYKFYPQIEYRYKAITIHRNIKMEMISQRNIDNFTREISVSMCNKTGKKIYSPYLEYKFIQLCLIFFLEDLCKGINNLLRISLFLKTYQKNLDWKKIRGLTNRYKVEKVINFVIFLTEEVFNSSHTNIIENTSWDFRLLRKLFSNGYISNSFYGVRSFNNEIKKDFYAHFVFSGIIAPIPLWKKSLFFLHPRRLIALLKYINVII